MSNFEANGNGVVGTAIDSGWRCPQCGQWVYGHGWQHFCPNPNPILYSPPVNYLPLYAMPTSMPEIKLGTVTRTITKIERHNDKPAIVITFDSGHTATVPVSDASKYHVGDRFIETWEREGTPHAR